MNKKKLKKALDKRKEELEKKMRNINQNLSQSTLDIIYNQKWYTYQHLPYGEGNSGVYIIKFPNNKRYVGSSNHVITRLKAHMNHLEYGSGTDWYQIAAEENGLLNEKLMERELEEIEKEYNFNFTPPPKDPREEYDRRGNRMGNRVGKKKLQQYKEDYAAWKELRHKEEEEAHYNEYLDRVHKIKSEFDDVWERRQDNIDRMVINVCYCDNYRELESAILSSIPEEEQCYWYNSIFK